MACRDCITGGLALLGLLAPGGWQEEGTGLWSHDDATEACSSRKLVTLAGPVAALSLIMCAGKGQEALGSRYLAMPGT